MDKIFLLPDAIANQIAAGEVIQRPANAVKELIENAIDAGATEIKVFLKEAGTQLVQVIDNGSGMSITDARMAFERHATSKIRQVEDIFNISTMGFRGEALASIAAVSQVELKTKREADEVGTYLLIENSKVQKQESIACVTGTSIAMKNLFFNIPARKNFLKKDTVELKNCIEEFIRIVLAFPTISFSLYHNDELLYKLDPIQLKKRIIQIMGASYESRIISIEDTSPYLKIYGFIGKPNSTKKIRGEQYFFVNQRFIRSPYLQHGVIQAYQQLIPHQTYPPFFIYFTINPNEIDINVHPTKQEIKFGDEKLIYAFLHATIKQALASHAFVPSIDFSLDADIIQTDAIQTPLTSEQTKTIVDKPIFQSYTKPHQAHIIEPSSHTKNWKNFFQSIEKNNHSHPTTTDTTTIFPSIPNVTQQTASLVENTLPTITDEPCLQLFHTYILSCIHNRCYIIHQQYAHERILYTAYMERMNTQDIHSQSLLLPIIYTCPIADKNILIEQLPDLASIGFHMIPQEGDFLVQAIPFDMKEAEVADFLNQWLHACLSNYIPLHDIAKRKDKMISMLAMQQAIKAGKMISTQEMKYIWNELSRCPYQNISIKGFPIFKELSIDNFKQLL